MNKNILKQIVSNHKNGKNIGFYSACTANENVIRTVLKHSKKHDSIAVIEATANQCNQFGGYTGMTPSEFKKFVTRIAKEEEYDLSKLHLGGDHLGPLIWNELNEDEAMRLAKELVYDYVKAGFTKIHLDTSMRLLDDDEVLTDTVIARRSAELARVAKKAYLERLEKDKKAIKPIFIIGSEVPIPGGAQDEDELSITKTQDLESTINEFKEQYLKHNVMDIYEDVVGIVVQPGVEFSDSGVVEYNRQDAKLLMEYLAQIDFVYEGHSTDYQPESALSEMVEDGVKILKVGPALTFALREAIVALAHIEKEMYKYSKVNKSNILEIMENVMLHNPVYWEKYYSGEENERYTKRFYSFSDRIRYYLPNDEIQNAIHVLKNNLNKNEIPLTLISQYMPQQYSIIRNTKNTMTVDELIESKITETLDIYLNATNQNKM